MVPAPNEEYEFFGGRLRIVGVEEYDTEMAVHWRMAPLPDVDAALPEEAEAGDRDTQGLPEDERDRIRLGDSGTTGSCYTTSSSATMPDTGTRRRVAELRGALMSWLDG
ncbi:MAG: hypothetical protein E6I76_19090 [Chloroflexi bacterium]|nr:MAG: hypothetical protein E6I76_19090 [Chloroflexota bacterium]